MRSFIATLSSAAIFTLLLALQPAVLRVHFKLSNLSVSLNLLLYGWALYNNLNGDMNAKQGAQGVISYNHAKPAFCGFHLCAVNESVGAETALALWLLLGSPRCALRSQTLTHEPSCNYQHSLWIGVNHELCWTCRQ